MKNKYVFLLLMVSMMVPWVAQSQDVINCTFENDSDTAGWVFVNGTATNQWYIGNATAYSSNKSLYISGYGGATNSYNISSTSLVYAYKTVTLTTGSYVLSFDWKCAGESSFDYFRVLLAPDTVSLTAGQTPLGGTSSSSFDVEAPPAGWLDLSSGRLNLQNNWQSLFTEFVVPADGNYKLVFFWGNDGSVGTDPAAAVDNILLTQPTCPRPTNIVSTNASATGITLSWTENGTASSWLIEYGITGFLHGQGTVETISGSNTHTLSNLSPGSVYDVYVQSICTNGDTSILCGGTFSTLCGDRDLPYTYGFENDATGTTAQFPYCWTRINDATGTTNYYPYVTSSSANAHSGAKYLYFYQSTTATYASNQYAVLPAINTTDYPMSNNEVLFWATMSSTTNGELIVGVMTDADEDSTFVPVDTLTITSGDYRLYTVSLSGYTGSGKHIAFRARRLSSSVYTYLDDITVREQSSCPMVTGSEVVSTTSTEIGLSWNSNAMHSSYHVYYGAPGFDADTVTPVTSNTSSILLSGLQPNTEYEYCIVASCTDGNDAYASYRNTFRTACVPMTTLPFSYDFEDAATGSSAQFPECWTRVNDATGTVDYYPYVNSGVNARNGNKYLYFYHSVTSTYANMQYAVLPPISTEDYSMADLELLFWAKMTSSTAGTLIVGVMSDPHNTNTFVPVDTLAIATGGYYLYTVNFANYSGDGQYIVIAGPRITGSPYTCVDDVLVREASPCPTVENPYVTNISEEQASIHWSSNTQHNTFELYYGTAGFVADTVVALSVSDTTLTLYGLQLDTEYEYYLVAFCSDGSIANTTYRYRFHTACLPIVHDSLPYVEDFEAYGSGSTSPISACWTKGTNYTTSYPYPYSTAACTGARGLYFYSNTTVYSYAALPLFDDSVNTLRLRFNIKRYSTVSSSYSSIIEVGVMSNPNDISSFELVETVDITNTAASSIHAMEIYLDQYRGSGRYIAFRAAPAVSPASYNYVYIDDVVVDPLPTCLRSEDLVATNITADGADLSWYNGSEYVSEYIVAVSTDENFNPDTCTNTFTTSDTTVSLAGLNSYTRYYWAVLADCGGDSSDWSGIATFQTLIDCGENGVNLIDTIGDGTSTGYTYTMYTYSTYPTGYSRYIFSSDELNAMGLQINNRINSVSLHAAGTAGTITGVTIYLMETDQEEFTSTSSDTVDRNDMTLVYTGTIRTSSGEWVDIVFDSVFTYSGQGNLMMLMARDGGTLSSSPNFYYGSTSPAYKCCSGYRSSSATAQNTRTRYTNRPNMVFNVCTEVPDCPRPINLAVTELNADNATITWEASAAQYVLAYDLSGFNPDTTDVTLAGTHILVSDTFYTFTNLMPNTEYEVYVRSICGGDTSVWSAPLAFRTECTPVVSLPVTYDFEDYATGTSVPFPNCWQRINDATGVYNYYPYISSSTTTAHSGSKYLYFYLTTSSGYARNELAVLPAIDTTLYPMNTLEFVFWGRGSTTTSYNRDIMVGIMTDPYDMSTFTAVDTITMTTTMAQYVVSFDGYTGYGSYPAFMMVLGSTYGHAYIDDVSIAVRSLCGRPDSLEFLSTTSASATLGWVDTIGASQWEIEYGEIDGTAIYHTTANTNPFTLSGLTPSTNYWYRVASYCSDGSLGGYSLNTCDFSTAQIPATIPYSYNFEDSTEWNNWQTISNQPVNWYRGTATAGEGSYSIYISDDNGQSRGTNMSAIVNACAYRDIDFGTTPGSFTVTFKVDAGGTTTASYDGLSVLLVDPAVYVEPSTAGIVSPWGNVNNLSLGYSRLTNGWETKTFYFDNVSGVRRMVFYWFNQSTGTTSFVGEPAAVDSVAVNVQPCPRPYDLSVDTTTVHSATLSWGGPTSDNYELVYRVVDADPSTNVSVNVTGTTHTLTGLTGNTEYVFWVRHLCSSALVSDYSNSLRFATECDLFVAVDTFYEDFHTTPATTYNTAGELPLCWEGYSNGTSANYMPHVVGSGSYWYTASDDRSITMTSGSETYGDTKIVRLPRFAEPISSMTLSYWMCTEAGSGYGTLSVGYMTGDDFENDFVSIRDIPASSATTHSGSGLQPTWGLYDTVVFDSVPASAQFIAFRWVHTSSFYSVAIDNVKVTADVSCPAPRITTTAQDYASATLNWSGNATSYEVNVKAQSDASWPEAVTVNNVYSYTATGLLPATTYMYRLRALCDAGDMSTWVEGIIVTDSLPCFAPENLTATPGLGSAQLIWTNGSSETAWNIHVWNTAFDETFDVTDNPATVTGLTPGTEYQAAIEAVCGGGVLMSGYGDTITFTTDICDPVTDVVATVEGTTATVTWNAGDNNDGNFVIEYGYEGFAAGTGTTLNATTNSIVLENLEGDTRYDVYVRAVCEGQYNSVWSDVAAFSTGVGINTAEGNAAVTIYPNPAEQNTTIRVSGVDGEVSVTIVDMTGRTVSTTTLECHGDCEKLLKVDGLAAGSYFVRLQSNGIDAVKKLVVK